MRSAVHAKLAPVRARQQWVFLLKSAAVGLLMSSVCGVGLGLGRWLVGWSLSTPAVIAVLAVGPLVGVLFGLARRASWWAAALAVDAHYRLKDRAVTALEFLAKQTPTTLHRLQLSEAVERLEGAQPREVVPLRLPRALPYAAILWFGAITLLVWPIASRSVQARPAEPLPEILEAAEQIAEDLKKLDELVPADQKPAIEGLLANLREKVEEMKQPGVDPREALAKLSEMQTAILAAQAQYNVGLVDGQLQALGAAMTGAASLNSAGRALQEAKFDKAAKELEELEEPQLADKDAKAVAEKMKQVAEAMGDAGLGQLSQAVSETAEGVENNHKAKFRQGSRELARQVRGHNQRRQIQQFLVGELARLSECKGQCQCKGNRLAKGRMPYKSLTPSSRFGLETSGNVVGDKTNLDAGRKLEEITGNPGEGPAEMETTHTPEGRQEAGRNYREVYQKYKKLSEAVLDSEPIPLGQRQTIRRYFELIRPQNGDE